MKLRDRSAGYPQDLEDSAGAQRTTPESGSRIGLAGYSPGVLSTPWCVQGASILCLEDYKGPKYPDMGYLGVPILGIVLVALGRYLAVAYLNP